jgi:beta-aspartyl-dipeptidase (metallo-type)
VYPTHVERNGELFDEAVELTRRGVPVDVDVIERDLAMWFRRFRERGGDVEKFTASSDAAQSAPSLLLDQVRDCVLQHGFALEEVLPLVTANPARVLKLHAKGAIAAGSDADLAVLDAKTLELRHLVAGGRVMMRDGTLRVREEFLKTFHRRIHLDASKEA